VNRTHTQKAMLTFTRDELRVLLAALEALARAPRGVGFADDREALRGRIAFAAAALDPRSGT